MQAVTDLHLLQQCSKGDKDAFAVIVHRYQNLVCSVAYSVLGDFTRSEDVGQEALVAAWNQLPQLEDLTKFRSWISSIARNIAINAIRSERASLPLIDDVESESFEPADLAIRQEEETLVWQALQGLPESYREPLVLYYRQDCSVTDVALSMDLTENTVRQRLHRGRALLRTEVTSLVERTLRKTVPGAAFTMAVMGSLVTLGAGTASAAVVSTAGKTSTPIILAAAKTGMGAGILGGLLGLVGAFLGPWMAMKNARYENERQILRDTNRRILYTLGLTFGPMLILFAGWRLWGLSSRLFFGGFISLIVIQIVAGMCILMFAQQKIKAAVAEDILVGTPRLPPNKLQKWVSQWKGRNWKSKATFLGLPLVHIQKSSLTEHWQMESQTNLKNVTPAKGWIAIGDTAYGVLLAMGGKACGGIAVGGLSVGVIAVGGIGIGIISASGLAVGLLAIGGVCLGAYSSGGLAIGWMALGFGAFAWKCAVGGCAIAREMAVGGYASAIEANTETAKQFVESSGFLQSAIRASTSRHAFWVIQCVWLVPLIIMFALSYQRTEVGEEPERTTTVD